MTKEQIEQWLISRGYQKNRWGHYMRPDRPTIRYKLSKLSIKLESSHRDSYKKLCWSRIRGNYYCNLSITPENKLSGMTRNALGIYPKKHADENKK